MVKVIGIIPARLNLDDCQTKLLKNICGYPLIVHVLKRSKMAKMLDNVFIGQRINEKIKGIIESYGGNVIKTKKDHQTGTDKLLKSLIYRCRYNINIQGDEALSSNHIDIAAKTFNSDPKIDIGMCISYFNKENSVLMSRL